MSVLSAAQLNRATLARQMLRRRNAIDVVAAVGRVDAVQAQSPASPYIALWNRVIDFDAVELDRAFAAHAIVKATLMRTTLHAVTAEDYPAFQHAMAGFLRASRLREPRFLSLGLPADAADAADDVVADVVAFASQPRTNAEFDAMLTARVGVLPAPRPVVGAADIRPRAARPDRRAVVLR